MKANFGLAFILFLLFSCSDDNKDVETKIIDGYKLTKNEIWSGEIQLRGDIEIPEGITLTILAGTKIYIATEGLVYDDGFEDRFVDIFVHGKLIINGTPGSIIEIKSDSAEPGNEDWWGIGVSSDGEIKMEYCRISDSYYGVFIFSGDHSSSQFNNCLFSNVHSSIIDMGENNLVFNHSSFIGDDYGYDLWGSDKTATIEYCEFENISMFDVELSNYSENTNNSFIDVSNTNFSSDSWKNISWSSDGKVTNSTVKVTNSYGNLKYPDSEYGNNVVIQNMSSGSVSGAGCGFTTGLKLGKIVAINKSNNIDEVIKHKEEIMQVLKKYQQRNETN